MTEDRDFRAAAGAARRTRKRRHDFQHVDQFLDALRADDAELVERAR
jgi:hypothetical protein